jgi:hypothetical protein
VPLALTGADPDRFGPWLRRDVQLSRQPEGLLLRGHAKFPQQALAPQQGPLGIDQVAAGQVSRDEQLVRGLRPRVSRQGPLRQRLGRSDVPPRQQ